MNTNLFYLSPPASNIPATILYHLFRLCRAGIQSISRILYLKTVDFSHFCAKFQYYYTKNNAIFQHFFSQKSAIFQDITR